MELTVHLPSGRAACVAALAVDTATVSDVQALAQQRLGTLGCLRPLRIGRRECEPIRLKAGPSKDPGSLTFHRGLVVKA